MKVIFTDLNGTLLDYNTCSHEAAIPALFRVQTQKTPLVFVTSKTRSEVEVWRQRLGNHHPFIVENGGAIFLPRRYFPFSCGATLWRESYDIIELGDPHASLVKALRAASAISRCKVMGFHEMPAEEISLRCQTPIEEAILAKQREYDEPFDILDADGAGRLLHAIEEQGKRWTRGSRFYHIIGNNDKAAAVQLLTELYRLAYSRVWTIGLGDGLNDSPFLSVVDVPIIVRSPHSETLRTMVPRGWLTRRRGPEGWNDAVLAMIPAHAAPSGP